MIKERIIRFSFAFLLFFFLLTSTTYAADRYWVGGTASWDGIAGNKWSTTSGGVGGASIPTTSDNCYFNASSSGIVSMGSGNTGCGNLDFTGFTGTWAGNAVMNISGPLTLGANMSRTYIGNITFNSTTSTSTITSNGKTLDSSITFNGVGGVFQLGDDLTTGSGKTINLTNGTFDANNHNITMGIFNSSNSNTRTLTMGSGTWTITGSSTTVWTTGTVTNFTLNRGNDIILSSNSATGTRTISNGVSGTSSLGFRIVGGTDTLTVTSSSGTHINNLIFDGFTGTFTNGVRNIYGDFTITSSSTNMTVASGTSVTTFAATSGTKTITTNGKTLDFPITFNGAGGTWILGDDLTMGNTRTLTLTTGTFNTNGKNVSVGLFSSSNANIRTLNMGSGQWTITGNNGTVWTTNTGNNLTFIKGNPINFNYSGSDGTRVIAPGGFDEDKVFDIVISTGFDRITLNSGNYNNVDFTNYSGVFSNGSISVFGSINLSSTLLMDQSKSRITLGGGIGSMPLRWSMGVNASNGKIYGIPNGEEKILIIDSVSGTATTSTMGADLSSNGSGKWYGGVLANNGKIYGIPYGSASLSILIIDPASGTATTSAMGADLSGSSKWYGGVLANNGKIYCMPWTSTSILIIDPASGTATTSAMGADLSGSSKWFGGALGTDGKIYGIPYVSTNVLIIDPELGTATTTNFGLDLSGSNKWLGGVLANNGKIYGIPYLSNSILIIDSEQGTATTSNMGAEISDDSGKWYGGVLATDNKIYSMPFGNNDMLIIDTVTETATTTQRNLDFIGRSNWLNGALGGDNNVYGIPYGSSDFLVFNPLTGTAYRSTMGMVKTSGTKTLATNGIVINAPLAIIGDGGTFNLADDLVMGSSSSLYIGGGTFNTNNHNITTGSINISGVDTRTINLGSSLITLTGTSTAVWGNTLTTNQTLNPQTSTVVLDGTNQSIQGSTTFYNLTKSSTTTDTLTFDANSTQTVTGTLTLQGQASSTLSLVSGTPGTKWNINPTTRSLSYLNVSDSNNTNSTPITAYSMTGITDAGNNTNWQFTEPTTVTPTVTTQTSSSGGSAQSRVNNLLAMGNTTLANQIAQQYNIAIPNTKTTPNTSIFMRSLQLGMTGNDVKQLQIFLNSKGYTVSYTGPGSPGNETTTFGTKTKLALIKYQKANNITPAIGYFGQVTRAQLSK